MRGRRTRICGLGGGGLGCRVGGGFPLLATVGNCKFIRKHIVVAVVVVVMLLVRAVSRIWDFSKCRKGWGLFGEERREVPPLLGRKGGEGGGERRRMNVRMYVQ